MNKIEKAILTELNEWDLSCSEEPTLKIELAKVLGRVVKNCSIPAVIKSVCEHDYQKVTKYGYKCKKCGKTGFSPIHG